MWESVSFPVGGNDDGSTSSTAIVAGRVKIVLAKELVLPEIGNFDGLAARHFVYKLDVLWIFGGRTCSVSSIQRAVIRSSHA